ncbi:MAG: TrkA C-terminal domain-containing protein [Phycisphaerae bacterium]
MASLRYMPNGPGWMLPRIDVHAPVTLVSPKDKAGQHLRVLAQLAERSEDASFINAWRRIPDVQRLKETLLRDSRFLELFVGKTSATQALVGRSVWEMRLPEGSFPAMVRREGDSFAPDSDTVLREGDHVILIGDPEGIEKLYRRFVQPEEEGE